MTNYVSVIDEKKLIADKTVPGIPGHIWDKLPEHPKQTQRDKRMKDRMNLP